MKIQSNWFDKLVGFAGRNLEEKVEHPEENVIHNLEASQTIMVEGKRYFISSVSWFGTVNDSDNVINIELRK